MDRRGFLLLLAAGLTGAAVGRGAAEVDLAAPGTPVVRPPAPATPTGPGGIVAVPAPTGVVDRLAGTGPQLALTIDDGSNGEVVAALVTLVRETGTRLTFFPNGSYRTWGDNAGDLWPLIESGQVAFGNHTWSHPDVTTLSDAEVVDELRRNQDFMRRTLGVPATPFWRPPFGSHDARTDAIAADLGHPTTVMWNGTFDDGRVVGAEGLLSAAHQWFAAQGIVVGHANQPALSTVLDQLLELIDTRQLVTVTLADVWSSPA
ncbi:peptidoglycan/xylan/chitin deacetylase (PgdA/CDA1 family) [Geodermatophilus bullaregiensis]|uniref:polysaccharide deacetylase family protein n=1 Tax=Geodermatophilus bullaregiensis TaxID=1564160 RepID=UPI00195B5C9E|nr:polysaccharide deacetylase family protein [Geodermatophilus bullaregiensis]MBM7807881.1 peptidoglycan/xylan/chitin deacetylase (PgdA/CDA1 family) [Geodermatophilus bullaregiensis]